MIQITRATATGVPLAAICTDCQQTWDEHVRDIDGLDFAAWMRLHMRGARLQTT